MAKTNYQQITKNYKIAVILKDGTTLHLRAIKPEDIEKVLAMMDHLNKCNISPDLKPTPNQISQKEAESYCIVDYNSTFTMAATVGEGAAERIVAFGNYHRLTTNDRARVVLFVEDAYQGKGIATHLMEQMATIARKNGIHFFQGEVNTNTTKIFKDIGFKAVESQENGILRMALDLAPTEIVEEKMAEREEIATVASLQAFLKPNSVAVIGASKSGGKLGNNVFTNLLRYGFKGTAYPVNPNAESVASVKAYSTIQDIPGDVDLAIVIVPAKFVLDVVEQCGRKGVRGIVVISSGFGESGEAGMQLQEKLLDTVRSYGMRLVGPNCMGISNTDDAVSMNATISAMPPLTGNIAFGTQSGGLGIAIVEYARQLNIGLSTFVSIGNRADVSSNDLMRYWKRDPATDVILLYLESFGNPRKFARIARDVTPHKPVVVVKSGRTAAGSQAARSHTGAMATAEIASQALFTQAGIIRVETLEELFDTANLLSHQPIPPGRRVAILTNGGGPGILTADSCADKGLKLPSFSKKTLDRLKELLSPQASLNNPIDMTAEAGAEEYLQALRLLAQDENIDIAIALLVSPVASRTENVAGAIRKIAPEFYRRGKTLVASFMGLRGAPIELGFGKKRFVPSYAFPEAAATAIAKACEYRDWLQIPRGTIPRIEGINKKKAQLIVSNALKSSKPRPLWLDADVTSHLLECYGIHSAKAKLVTSADRAVESAKEIGFPVCLKLLSNSITHKTEVGGVILDLRSPREVKQAFSKLKKQLLHLGREDEMQGAIIQQMIPEGIEAIVGVTQDPSFGPLILFGLGGIYTELFKDVTFRIHPLSNTDARDMVHSVKAYQLLEGWRGSKPSDIKAIEELLLRVSAMVEDIYQIAEIDLNPVKVLEQGSGYVVVDARIMLS